MRVFIFQFDRFTSYKSHIQIYANSLELTSIYERIAKKIDAEKTVQQLILNTLNITEMKLFAQPIKYNPFQHYST